jgi:hypothetical protein
MSKVTRSLRRRRVNASGGGTGEIGDFLDTAFDKEQLSFRVQRNAMVMVPALPGDDGARPFSVSNVLRSNVRMTDLLEQASPSPSRPYNESPAHWEAQTGPPMIRQE